MKIVSFIDPPQSEAIEKILRHCGLCKASAPRGPPDPVSLVHDLDYDSMEHTPELMFIDMDTYLSTF